jgi:diguanylate cyclase (GGDEF)-like protein
VGRDAAEIGLDPRFLAQQDGRRMEIELERDGGTLVFEASMTTLVVEGDRMRCAFLHDITERRTFERRLRHLADHDALTGLLNRARFICEVELESARLRRYDGRAAVLVLDIDNFKHLNDSLGHKAGDEYLVSLAGALRTRLRESDHLCRLGGDEFAALMPTTDADGARRTADSLVEIIRHHAPVLGGRPVRLSASVGGVVFGAEPVTPEELLAAADVAMYAAKEAGRDRSTVVEGSDIQGEPAGSRLTWAERIRGALAEDRLVLHAQPIVDLATGAVDRLELLLRMVDDGGELLLPGAFLGTAERFDLVQAIDRWVTTRAIELLDGHDFSLAINVSGRSIGDPELLATVERGLRDRSIAPGRLVFEITETAAIANIATAREFADRLRALGCRLALDDFGTGFGSFYYLKHMPADDVKIDGDFVRDMAASPVDQEVVRAVVAVAGALGPRTIAECVEDEATHALVREYGVDLGQGWHYGRPAPVADVIATLR